MLHLHQLRLLVLQLGDSWGRMSPPPLHFWGAELENQTHGVSTRPGTTLWGDGGEGPMTFWTALSQTWELSRSLAGTAVPAL